MIEKFNGIFYLIIYLVHLLELVFTHFKLFLALKASWKDLV